MAHIDQPKWTFFWGWCYSQDRPVNSHSVSMQDGPANSLSIHINTGPSACILNTDVAIYRTVLNNCTSGYSQDHDAKPSCSSSESE